METESPLTQLRCVVVTPERALVDETTDFVAMPMFDGELGVLPGRAPLIGRLGYGELRLVQGKITHRYYVDGGFVQVKDNVVTLLTSKAMKAEEVTLESAEAALKAAQIPSSGEMSAESRNKAQERARAQLRLAKRRNENGGH